MGVTKGLSIFGKKKKKKKKKEIKHLMVRRKPSPGHFIATLLFVSCILVPVLQTHGTVF